MESNTRRFEKTESAFSRTGITASEKHAALLGRYEAVAFFRSAGFQPAFSSEDGEPLAGNTKKAPFRPTKSGLEARATFMTQ